MSLTFAGCKQEVADDEKPDATEVANNPEEEAESAIKKTMSALINSGTISTLVENAFESGKLTITFGDMLNNTLYINSADDAFTNSFLINDGTEEYSIDLYKRGSEFAIRSSALGGSTYGVDLSTAGEDLKDSAIWTILGTDYDTFMSEYSVILDGVLAMVEGMDMQKFEKEANDFAANLSAALKDVEVTSEETMVDIDGKKVPAINVTFNLTEEDLEAVIAVCLDTIKAATGDIVATLATIDDMEYSSSDEIVDELFDEIKTELEALLAEVNIHADLSVSINPDTGYAMCISMDGAMDVLDEAMKECQTVDVDVAIVFGEDPTTSNHSYVEVQLTADEESISFGIDLETRSEGDIRTTELKVFVDVDAEEHEFIVKIEHDAKENTYRAAALADKEELGAIEGEYELTDNCFVLSVDSLTLLGETETIGLRIVAEATDVLDMPEMPDYTNILTMSEEEWATLMAVSYSVLQ